jgi:D-lactate dehydrogenase
MPRCAALTSGSITWWASTCTAKRWASIAGCGTIGGKLARLLHGFGCRLLGHDVQENDELTRRYDLEYVPLAVPYAQTNVISVHTPLTAATRHLLGPDELA